MVQQLWTAVWRFLRKMKIELPYDPAIQLLGIYPDKAVIHKDACTPMCTAVLFITAKTRKQLNCQSTDEWFKKIWCIHTHTHTHTMEYYPHVKKNVMMPLAAT